MKKLLIATFILLNYKGIAQLPDEIFAAPSRETAIFTKLPEESLQTKSLDYPSVQAEKSTQPSVAPKSTFSIQEHFDKFKNTPLTDNEKYQPVQVSQEYLDKLDEEKRVRDEMNKRASDNEDLKTAIPIIVIIIFVVSAVAFLLYTLMNPTETATKEVELNKRGKNIELRERELLLQEREAELIRKEKLLADRNLNS